MKENTFCTRCGAELKSHSKYCGDCGYEKRFIRSINSGKKNIKISCTRCKTEISPFWKFCGICGELIPQKQCEKPPSQKKTKSITKPEKNVPEKRVIQSLNWTGIEELRKEGMNLLRLEKYSESIQEFDKILSQYPSDSEAFKWKWLAQERLDREKPTPSIKNRENLNYTSGAFKNEALAVSSHINIDGNDLIQCYLSEILRTYGDTIIHDFKKISALLSDYCKGENIRGRRLLLRAIEERIPQDLIKNQKTDLNFVLIEEYEQRLEKKHGTSPELCKWAVNSWILALGIKKN